jgi:hypothetical protein
LPNKSDGVTRASIEARLESLRVEVHDTLKECQDQDRISVVLRRDLAEFLVDTIGIVLRGKNIEKLFGLTRVGRPSVKVQHKADMLKVHRMRQDKPQITFPEIAKAIKWKAGADSLRVQYRRYKDEVAAQMRQDRALEDAKVLLGLRQRNNNQKK